MNLAEKNVSEAMQALMTDLDKTVTEIAGQPMGISLFVFNAEAGGRVNYVSNCDRDQVYSALMSIINGWKSGMPDIPAHEFQ